MPSFRDTAGREWNVQLHVDAVRKVRAEAGVDLLKIGDAATLGQLVDDPCTLAGVLWTVLQDQAERDGIAPEQFGRSLGGQSIEDATEALLQALCDFFPKRRADLLRTVLAKLKRVEQLQLDRAEAELAAVDDQQLADQIRSRMPGG